MSPTSVVVVPCFNEAERLQGEVFLEYLDTHLDVSFLFVNDGSEDDTLGRLQALAEARPGRALLLDIEHNSGKAEAVRRGVLHALQVVPDATFVGFWDADLATPLSVIDEFVQVMSGSDDIFLVMGARVRLLGRWITRRKSRHYLGRVFATAASLVLGVPVYDTQCGAKLLRNDDRLVRAFAEPWRTGWIFDVELLARLKLLQDADEGRWRLSRCIVEVPLTRWTDVPGSKIRSRDFVVSARELVLLAGGLHLPFARRAIFGDVGR